MCVVVAKRTLGLVLIFVIICMVLSFIVFVGTVCFLIVLYVLLKNR